MRDRPLRVVLADDEPAARTGLERMLGDEPAFEIVASCRNGAEARAAIETHHPDVALLDIAMPLVSGIDVVRGLAADRRPAVVFITAFDRYAIEAFELHAVDYLLKPFDPDRLHASMAHVRERLRGDGVRREDAEARLDALLDELERRVRNPDRLTVKQGDRILLIGLDELDWCEAADNYIRLHASGRKYLIRETMDAFARRLGAGRFARIHRSYIVNLSRIRELRPLAHGEYRVSLVDGTRLTLSRTYRDAVLASTLTAEHPGRGH